MRNKQPHYYLSMQVPLSAQEQQQFRMWCVQQRIAMSEFVAAAIRRALARTARTEKTTEESSTFEKDGEL